MQVIDLSVLLDEKTPVYPGDPATKIEPVGVFARDGWNDHYISVGNHVGTHIDAPLHMTAEGRNLDQIPVDQFVGQGRYIKVDQNFDIEKVRAAGIRAGDMVLFDTGMSEHYQEAKYFEDYPVMSEEIATYLVTQKVKMVGLDTGMPTRRTDSLYIKYYSGEVC